MKATPHDEAVSDMVDDSQVSHVHDYSYVMHDDMLLVDASLLVHEGY